MFSAIDSCAIFVSDINVTFHNDSGLEVMVLTNNANIELQSITSKNIPNIKMQSMTSISGSNAKTSQATKDTY